MCRGKEENCKRGISEDRNNQNMLYAYMNMLKLNPLF
jgi:hypothetical protein